MAGMEWMRDNYKIRSVCYPSVLNLALSFRATIMFAENILSSEGILMVDQKRSIQAAAEARDSNDWEQTKDKRGKNLRLSKSDSPQSGHLSATSTPVQSGRPKALKPMVENAVDASHRPESPFIPRCVQCLISVANTLHAAYHLGSLIFVFVLLYLYSTRS